MASRRREEELAARLANASDRGMAELLKRMESEHRTLLRQQLDTLHQVVMASRSPPSAVLQLTDQHGQEIQVRGCCCLLSVCVNVHPFFFTQASKYMYTPLYTNVPLCTDILYLARDRTFLFMHIIQGVPKKCNPQKMIITSTPVGQMTSYLVCINFSLCTTCVQSGKFVGQMI